MAVVAILMPGGSLLLISPTLSPLAALGDGLDKEALWWLSMMMTSDLWLIVHESNRAMSPHALAQDWRLDDKIGIEHAGPDFVVI